LGYETAKNEQAFLEGRITDLKSILMSATIIDPTDVPTDRVGIGSVVKVKDLDYGDEWEFRMVGSYEADPDNDRISNESPIGESLMDRKVGEVVEATTPGGKIRYEIVSIRRQGE
jgi:transcription elongation factor GreA